MRLRVIFGALSVYGALWGLAFLAQLDGCQQQAPTCLVLSVGGPNGFAHAGAIDALKELGVEISCVYGNSMGAVVGSLYAQNPSDSPAVSIKRVFQEYRFATEQQIGDQAVDGFLVGAALALLSGGTLGWETMLGASAVGAGSVAEFDNVRFREVLDRHFGYAVIDTLPVPFATSYQSKDNESLEFVVASSGNLAQAVARSANNPYIFAGTSLKHLDPGSDRMAATPIEDAYRLFKPARIVAINVTGKSAHYGIIGDCEVTEIVVEIPSGGQIDSADLESTIDRMYEYGYRAVMKRYGK